jgi:glycosyltransferase involved in cell wall biosynthesis
VSLNPDSPDGSGLSIVVRGDEPLEIAPLLASLHAQDSMAWQLVVATSSTGADWPADDRVVVIELPHDASRSEGLAASTGAATGVALAVVGAGDRLEPGAVSAILGAFRADDVALVYTEGWDSAGEPAALKPVFSPERLRNQYYLGPLVAYRRSTVAAAGGIREDVPGAELYDLALRLSESAGRALRLEERLITVASDNNLDGDPAEPSVADSLTAVLSAHLDRTGGGEVLSVGPDGVCDTRRPVRGSPLVSIVIPTRGDSAIIRGEERCLIVEAVRSVIESSTYSNYEFVVVIDDVAPAKVRVELEQLAGNRIRFVGWSQPFSFSGKMNLGIVHARGEYVLLLNDDVEVISPGWIEALLALAQRPGAGLVGAMLYFEDDTIQHAGHAYYRSDVTHIGLNSERGSAGPGGAFRVEREVDGVTAACALLSRELFFAAGGFSPLLPGNFNDVDLCMKIAKLGYQSYWTPHAELYHYESKSRDPRVALYEITTAWGRWEPGFWESRFWPENPHTLYRADVRP